MSMYCESCEERGERAEAERDALAARLAEAENLLRSLATWGTETRPFYDARRKAEVFVGRAVNGRGSPNAP